MLRTMLVAAILSAGCTDNDVEIEPIDSPDATASGYERCSDICAPGTIIRIVIGTTVSFSCPVDWATTPVICKP